MLNENKKRNNIAKKYINNLTKKLFKIDYKNFIHFIVLQSLVNNIDIKIP